MLRQIDEKLIRPEVLMNSSDMAKLGCNNCEGCSECCKERAEAITLDAYDIALLKSNLNFSFEGLIDKGYITLSMVDGAALPSLSRKKDKDECIFLNEEGKCDIHPFRPGICRMFPLARIYHEDGSFSYFIQKGECDKATGVKIKISKWLDYKDIHAYEAAVREFHDALRVLRAECKAEDDQQKLVKLQTMFLHKWFIEYEI